MIKIQYLANICSDHSRAALESRRLVHRGVWTQIQSARNAVTRNVGNSVVRAVQVLPAPSTCFTTSIPRAGDEFAAF